MWGGEAIACYDMAHILVKEGHNVHVICQAIQRQFVETTDGVIVHHVGGNAKRYSILAKIDYSVHAIIALCSLMLHMNVDIVEGFSEGSEAFLYVLLKKFRIVNKPIILHAHGSIRYSSLNVYPFNGIISLSTRFLQLLSDFSAKNSDLVIAISPIIKKELVNVVGVKESRVSFILVPRDSEKYHYITSDIRQKLKVSSTDNLVVTVGRLEKRKGTDTLFLAIPVVLKSFPNTKFLIIGHDTPIVKNNGSFYNFLKDMAFKGNFTHSVLFMDHVSELELVMIYSASDVVVSPSVHEVSTSVPIEAMLCGKPVVVTDTGIARELALDGSNGLIVPPGNFLELANGIIQMLSFNPYQKEMISVRNCESIKSTFSFTIWSKQLSDLHEKFKQ